MKAVKEHRILVFGVFGELENTTLMYSSKDHTWSQLAQMPATVLSPATCVLGTGVHLLVVFLHECNV